MSGSLSKDHKHKNCAAEVEIKLNPLIDLLDEQDVSMRALFAKALNLYVSPGADTTSEKEKLDQLKRAIDESFNQAGGVC